MILPRNCGSRGEAGDLLQDLFAGQIARMRLAGEDDLHRQLRIVDQRRDLLQILEQQVGPLVRGKAAGKADRQCVAD